MYVLRAIAVVLCGIMSLRLCRAQISFPGACPSDMQAIKDFDLAKYMGKWYEAEKYFSVFEVGGKCITATYTLNDNGTVRVVNSEIKSITGKKSEVVGEATQDSQSGEGKLSVRIPALPGNASAPYWVIDTDYESYALVWGCNKLGIVHTINAWILTRERNPPKDIIQKGRDAAKDNNISLFYFLVTDQKHCPDDI